MKSGCRAGEERREPVDDCCQRYRKIERRAESYSLQGCKAFRLAVNRKSIGVMPSLNSVRPVEVNGGEEVVTVGGRI